MTLPDVVRSAEPSIGFIAAKASIASQHYENLFTFVTACVAKYLNYASPATMGIAPDVAADLIEKSPTWKTTDFLMCFKFFRQRQDLEGLKIFGNTVTGQKLMEMVAVYEEHRAIEFEKFRTEQAGNYRDKNREANPMVQDIAKKLRDKGMSATGDRVLGNQYDEYLADKERKGLGGVANQYPHGTPDENYFQREHGAPKDAA